MPSATIQIVARCRRGESRSQPKIQSPRKVASRKKAARPSIASGAPKTSPTILGVDGPVHPELELLDEAGRDADREVDQQQRAEEARQPQPLLVARAVPERLHHRHERRQPERQRHEQEVVDRRRRELDPREVDRRRGRSGTRRRSSDGLGGRRRLPLDARELALDQGALALAEAGPDPLHEHVHAPADSGRRGSRGERRGR